MRTFPGQLLIDEQQFIEKFSGIKAFLFDWDGVFNDGRKGIGRQSSFTETDSMGINLLRFSHWLKHNQQLPVTGIITGAENEMAHSFAGREHFHAVYSNFKNKAEAFTDLINSFRLEPHEVAFVFDDVLDIAIAKQCGLRIAVSTVPGNWFNSYLKENKAADYFTEGAGNQFAIRELCELLINLNGNYTETLNQRIAFNEDYVQYLQQRNNIEPLERKKSH